MTEEFQSRLWQAISCRGPDECWPYIGAAQITFEGGPISKRRAAWIVTHGKIRKGRNVLATCGAGPCCNPAHLFLGSKKDQAELMVKLGRSTAGERNQTAKLDEAKAREILALKGKAIAKDVAPLYGVQPGAINAIWRREYWKHIS